MPAFATRPSARMRPFAVPMNCAERSIVMIERGGSYKVRAAIESVISSSERMQPPCTVPQLVVNSGLISRDRRAAPLSSESIFTPRCSAKRIFLTNSATAGETVAI